MSLTAEAYRESKWGSYPSLRKALENKQIPSSYYGFSSASDNLFEAMGRLIEIAVLVPEYENDIKDIAASDGRDEMHHDLHKVQEQLEQVCDFFRGAIDNMWRLRREL